MALAVFLQSETEEPAGVAGACFGVAMGTPAFA